MNEMNDYPSKKSIVNDEDQWVIHVDRRHHCTTLILIVKYLFVLKLEKICHDQKVKNNDLIV